MKTYWIKIICLFALVAVVFSSAGAIRPLTMAKLAGAEKEPEALNLPAPELVGGPWINSLRQLSRQSARLCKLAETVCR